MPRNPNMIFVECLRTKTEKRLKMIKRAHKNLQNNVYLKYTSQKIYLIWKTSICSPAMLYFGSTTASTLSCVASSGSQQSLRCKDGVGQVMRRLLRGRFPHHRGVKSMKPTQLGVAKQPGSASAGAPCP